MHRVSECFRYNLKRIGRFSVVVKINFISYHNFQIKIIS